MGDGAERFLVTPQTPILEVARVINATGKGMALVVDGDRTPLIAIVTDGDIRRHMLAQGSMKDACATIMCKQPTVVRARTSRAEILATMRRLGLQNIPVVDDDGVPLDIIHLRDLGQTERPGAVIMAGGEGQRLMPLTEKLPKPMVEVGGVPILQTIVERFAAAGIDQIYLAVNYLGEIIERHFGDGSRFGVEITYLREPRKLGTAGALSMLDGDAPRTLVVTNGDVLTEVNLPAMLDFHARRRAAITVAAIRYRLDIPYGVLRLAEHFVLGVEEKPKHDLLCNAGVYVLDADVLRFVQTDAPFDMTDLLSAVIREGLPVAAFPVHEYWIDIGKREDLERARSDWQR
jgi:dTDP-glucose pyrophosphorylase